MQSLALATLALSALGAAAPPKPIAERASQDPHAESEPNDRLGCADVLGTLPDLRPLTAHGEIAHAEDRDFFRIDVLVPTVIDVRVVTGAALMSLSSVGGSGTSDPEYTDSFLPVLTLYGPDGRVIFMHASTAPNLLLMEFPVPLYGASFYAELMAWPGSFGHYGLQISAH